MSCEILGHPSSPERMLLGSTMTGWESGLGEHRAWPELINMRSVLSMKQRMRDYMSEDTNLYTDMAHVLQVFLNVFLVHTNV